MSSKARGDFIGRLTRDAELRYTQSGMAICNFSIVTNDKIKNPASGEYKDEPSFWDCQLWGKQGESLSQYLTKGKIIGLDGNLRVESWEQDGQKRTKVKINVQNVVLIAGQGNTGASQENVSQTPPRSTSGNSRQPSQPPANGSDDFADDIPW
jgi:single-strand DNA-binding protein